MGRKRKTNKIAKVHPELEGLELKINELGEIQSNIDIDKINAFLDKSVPDKKLMNRNDDKYQQEFKEQYMNQLDDEEDPEYVEESADEEEEDFDKLIKEEDEGGEKKEED